jgi:hypothetical protein
MLYAPIPIDLINDVSIYCISTTGGQYSPFYLIPVRCLRRFIECNWREIFHHSSSQEMKDAAADQYNKLTVNYINELVFPDGEDISTIVSKVMAAGPDHTGTGSDSNNKQLLCGFRDTLQFGKFMIIMMLPLSLSFLSHIFSFSCLFPVRSYIYAVWQLQ